MGALLDKYFFDIEIRLLILCVMILVSLFLLGWALYDCWRNEPEEGGSQLTWLCLILFTGGWGTFAYLFLRRPQRKAELGRRSTE
jgi:hypothetical protein